MAKQWVDITTLNNTTPFGKVRWLQNLTIAYNTSNMLEFSELSGITIDGRSWSNNSGPSWGYASTHRVANNDDSFTCTFLNEYRTSNDVTVSPFNSTAGTAVHDVKRSEYYDDVVTMGGQTFYEVDFTTWSGYTPLYYCYTGTSVSAGQVYVEIDVDPIVVDKDKLSFKSSGETKNVVVVSDNPWTATTSEAWVSLSTSSGASGETTLSVTTPEYTSTTEDRTATITITDGEFSVSINVTQAKKREGGVSEMYLGSLNMEAAYLGNIPIGSIYLGENLVYSSGPFQGLKVTPSSFRFDYTGGTGEFIVKSTEDWVLTSDSNYISTSVATGNSGETTVGFTALTNSTTAEVVTLITVTTVGGVYSKNVTVNIKKQRILVPDIPTNQIWYKTSDSPNISASGQVGTLSSTSTIVSDVYDANEGYRIATFNGDLTAIPGGVFHYDTTDIREIILPPSIVRVGDYAFNNIAGIQSIKFSNSCVITQLGHEAICECPDLIELRMPTVTNSVGFWTCMGLSAATAITFVQTSGVTSWYGGMSADYQCFANCTNLREFLLPGNVVEFRLYDANKPNYPTTSMTNDAWADLFNDLGTVNNVAMYIGPDNVNSLPNSVKSIATNKGWTLST